MPNEIQTSIEERWGPIIVAIRDRAKARGFTVVVVDPSACPSCGQTFDGDLSAARNLIAENKPADPGA